MLEQNRVFAKPSATLQSRNLWERNISSQSTRRGWIHKTGVYHDATSYDWTGKRTYESFSSAVNTEMGGIGHLLIGWWNETVSCRMSFKAAKTGQSIRSTRLRRQRRDDQRSGLSPCNRRLMVVFLNFLVLIQMKIGLVFFQ
jgi:hypothetical protein